MHLLHPQNPPMKIRLFSWLFLMPMICLLSIGFCISAVSGQCLGDQQSLLLQLKNSLVFDSASSIKLVHWNQSVDCCSWEGVTCNEGRIIGLDLTNESISGGLDHSSSLFRLQYLQHLSLASNNFSDKIPSQFDKLTNLSYLSLSNACFTGQIPIAISHLTRLVTLDLSTDDFKCEFYYSLKLESPNLKMLVQNLSELMELHLDRVNISAQGYEWGTALSSSLPKLRVLSLSNCLLPGPLDSSLTNLKSLSIIHLDDNDFDGPVPESFADFKNLTSLSLIYSGLNGTFPEKIFQIPTLETLDLSYNYHLQGSLPEFPLNGSLRMLVLYDTNFSGTLPNSIGHLKMLSVIDLSYCNFNGSIPSFSMGKNLTTIDLSGNNLTGQITSTRWEELLNLKFLDLSHNSLEGSIPISLFSHPSLSELLLYNNQFSGQLNELLNVSSCLLETLYLSYNNLEGPIPMSLFEIQSLRSLSLSGNNFSGQLNELSSVSSCLLETLYLRYNNLEGPIPMSLFEIQSLRSLSLSGNHFSGQLNELSSVTSCLLETLDLSYNNLEGPIPMSLFEIRSLRSLSLSWNNFSGSLQLNVILTMGNFTDLDLSHNRLGLASSKLKTYPHFLINQSTLSNLDLSDNQIHGEIPNWIWKLPYLGSLNLSYNYLETLDFPLLNMSSLSSLDLHSNQLQGQLSVFPKHATYLDFSGNKFSSVIPANIGNFLRNTYFFSLSSNKFNGSIPRSICNASNLLVLDLSNNSLSGTIPQCLFMMSGEPQSLHVTHLSRSQKVPVKPNPNQVLGVLNLWRNNLIGTIPNVFPSNCDLKTLNLNGNQLEGKLPKSLAHCTSLEVLDLGNNHIEDAFPCYLKNISVLHILILRSNKFYGPIVCRGPNSSWPMLQIVDVAANNFTGKLPIKYLSDWKAIIDEKNKAESHLNHLQFSSGPDNFNRADDRPVISYQYMITVTMKGLEAKLVKILTIFTSLDFSCNNFDGHIPEEVGELKLLYILNLSHNAFMGQIPRSLRKLTNLESLDLSSNELSGEIPDQLADGLIFLSVLNLSFNQLVGKIPYVNQFATFSKNSYEGNIGLCGLPLKEKCTHEEPRSSPPTSKESHSNFGNAIDWNFLSVELGFIFGFGIFIGPLMFWKKWRICYYKHADDIFFKMFPQLYLRIENRQRRAHRNQGQGAHRNQGRRH